MDFSLPGALSPQQYHTGKDKPTYTVIFPGQGSQRTGMAEDFVQEFPTARRIFEHASKILDMDLFELCHTENAKLDLTEYTQPAIVCTEIAMLAVLREAFALNDTLWGGHSLGEYTALVAAGAIPFDCAIRLVRERGKLMQSALPQGEGAMTAVLQVGLDTVQVQKIAQKYELDTANFNSPSQIVLSGLTSAMDSAIPEIEALVSSNEGRVVRLQVSGPFHSRWMRNIEPAYRRVLESESSFFKSDKACRVTSNTLGGFHSGSLPKLIDALARQISSPVLWLENMTYIIKDLNQPIIELGPSAVLQKFFKDLGIPVSGIISVRHAARTFKEQNA